MNLIQPSDDSNTEPENSDQDAPLPIEALEVTWTPDGPRVENAPLPEHLEVDDALWARAESAKVRSEYPRLWVEIVEHAGDVDLDLASPTYGQMKPGPERSMLHIDAVNVTAVYEVVGRASGDSASPEGARLLKLQSWAER